MMAETVIDTLIGKVAHIQYMKDIDKQVQPYVIDYTSMQAL